jgi:hypothetical protein
MLHAWKTLLDFIITKAVDVFIKFGRFGVVEKILSLKVPMGDVIVMGIQVK